MHLDFRFFNADEKGEGEICMWGRNVMMGYINREDKTNEDIDEEGWLHSGDLGFQDEEGFVFVTGQENISCFEKTDFRFGCVECCFDWKLVERESILTDKESRREKLIEVKNIIKKGNLTI